MSLSSLDSELIENAPNENLNYKDDEIVLDKAGKEKERARRLEGFSGSKLSVVHDIKNDVQKVVEGEDDVKMDVDYSNLQLHTTMTLITTGKPHKLMKHSSDAFPNAVRRLGKSCVPCRRPCTGIKLLELIDHRRVGCYGLCQRKHVLNTVDANAETLIARVDNNQREELENLVNNYCEQYLLAWDVTQSAGFTSAFHAEFPLQDADLASVDLKATSDKSWSLSFSDCRITRKSVSEMDLIDFLEENNVQRLRSMNRYTLSLEV